ncbi:Terminal uridylyltransferase 7-like [Homarus americanus]|uniref:Terminal uridylyltransferase 7-like n=1 Tax=Homarus americanus TaxID=6706 RepID=A0A8J5TM88_HOMAM|nr:Terminal uridylyltransferase 7-like [Homarus americanus]
MKAFIRGREIFGTPVMATPPGYRNLVDYLFDSKQLTDGAPPNDRGCRFCGKIGHIQKDCPKKRLNMERKEKKERQKDRRELRKFTTEAEDREGERQKQSSEQKTTQEAQESESRGVGGGPALPAASGAPHTLKTPEGNLKLTIPLDMMEDHCEKWESNQEYRIKGDKILGMRRYSLESFDERKVGKETLICHCVPPQVDERYIWTVNWNKAARKISDGTDISPHPFSSIYNLILKMVEIHIYQTQEPDQSDSPVVCVSKVEIPENVGQVLFEKMKEVQDKRKQKKKERMKVRYRREMAGPGYKRGQNFEPGKKGSVNLGNKGSGRFDLQNPNNLRGSQENNGYNRYNLPDRTSRDIKNHYIRANPNNPQIACSSSEDENFAQRVVRRKGKQKIHPDSAVHTGQKNHNNSKDSGNVQGNVGGFKKSKKFSSKEGAIKAKHQPSLGLTCRLVPVGPEKEIVTISQTTDRSTCKQQNVVKLTPVPHSEVARTTNSANHESQGTLPRSGVVVTLPGDGSDSRLVTVMDGATNGANSHKKRRKPKPRKGKKGGSKFESQNEGENSNRKNANKSKPYQGVTTAPTTQTHQHQQQYPYSISPAALFHMASQAAGGQMSAVLLPSVSESGNIRPGIPVSTASSVGSGGTASGSGSGAPPPPGFTAPIAINYHGQQVDAVSFNKLIMSPLYRSPVSQPDGQSAVSNTPSQSFISVGQSLSGPVAGVYAVQQGSGGGQFTNLAPTVAGHTPHAFGDPSLSQQQVPFDTRHFIPQQLAQGLHQGIPQGLPQGIAAPVPQGVPQGVAQGIQGGTGVSLPPPGLTSSVPQGLSQNVPQGVPQGLHQSLPGGVSQVSMGSALSQGIQAVPMGHALQQHHYPQPSYPQQGYQMPVPGPSGFYPEFVFGDPGLQNPSPSGQGPPTIPAEMMTEMPFQRPDVYDTQMQALPQYLPSSLPQHQSLISQISQPHPSVGLPPHHTPLSATGPTAAYTPSSVIYIDGERDASQLLH